MPLSTAIDDLRETIDPPDVLVEEPPRAKAMPNENVCAHCGGEAELRFDGHDPATLRTAGREPCPCPKPWRLCTRCYVGWHRWYSYKWYKDGRVTCGYCSAEGDTIEALFPFQKI